MYAGYGVLDYKPTDKISAQLGARVDRWDASQAQLSDVTGNSAAQDFTSLSPRLAIIAKPTPRDIAKLMIGRAFRAPSTYEYFYNDGGTTEVTSDCCGERLRPETTYSAELEWTHRLGRSWSALGSLYATLARDIIETATVTSDVLAQHPEYSTDAFYYRNSSEDQILTGVDAEVRRELRAGIMLSGQVGALLARYSAAPAPDVSDNRRIPNAPVVFGAVKAIAPIVANRLTIAARAAFEDRRRINLASDALTDRAVIADVVLSGTLPRYGLDYAAGVYNLLDWRLSLPAEPFAAEVIPQAGRTFIVSLTLTR